MKTLRKGEIRRDKLDSRKIALEACLVQRRRVFRLVPAVGININGVRHLAACNPLSKANLRTCFGQGVVSTMGKPSEVFV